MSLPARATGPVRPGGRRPAPASRAVQAQSTFRAAVDLVQVDVSVLDKDRRPIRGLSAAEFTVLEDGKRRPVVAFTAVDLPGPAGLPAAPWTRDVAPDVATNSIPEEGRLVVILLDRSIPDGQPTLTARAIAKAAVNELGAGDLAAVVYTGSGTPQAFTNDRGRLLAAIDRSYPAAELSAEANAMFDSLMAGFQFPANWQSTALPALGFGADCLCGACVLNAIAQIADAVRDVARRRKSLLFIGSDAQIETTEPICIDPVRKARGIMFRALDLANLTVHALDPVGLETLSFQASSPRGGYRGRANLVRQGNISVLPDRTGGRTVLNTNNPAARISEIFHESDSYYLLGFEPAVADGRRHDISVKVDRRGVDVRTRHAYVANAAPPPLAGRSEAGTSARDAIAGLMPKREGVTLSASVAPFEIPGSHEPVLTVALHVRHDPGPVPSGPAAGPEPVEIVTAVFTMDGRPLGALRQTLLVTPQVGATGGAIYDVLQRIPAKPGRFELRIGLSNSARHQAGSVHAFVDVPSYGKTPLTLSEIAVYAPVGITAMKDNFTDVLPAPPTARREFDRRERATAFLRVYEGGSGPIVPVSLSTGILDQNNRQRFGQKTSPSPEDFDGTRTADYAVDLPLADLEPGSYLLTIEAKAGLWSARRDVRFAVK